MRGYNKITKVLFDIYLRTIQELQNKRILQLLLLKKYKDLEKLTCENENDNDLFLRSFSWYLSLVIIPQIGFLWKRKYNLML
jgi:hypothetical protein